MAYPDQVFGGSWYACEHCNFAGDGPELAAAYWHTSVEHAAVTLANRCNLPRLVEDPEAVNHYVVKHVQERFRIARFWDDCRCAPAATIDAMQQLLDELGIGVAWQRPEWRQRGGHFLGFADRKAIIAFAGRGVLAGKGWKQAVVMAYHDLPGRIRGFVVMGSHEGVSGSFYLPVTRGVAEAGIGFLDTARFDADSPVIVVPNPKLAIKLQLNHLRDNESPLRIVSTWEDSLFTTRIWDAVTAPTIHWAPEHREQAIVNAYRARGAASLVGPKHGTLDSYLDKRPAEGTFRHVVHKAMPRENALEITVAHHKPSYAVTLFDRIGFSSTARGQFLAKCSEDTREAILAALNKAHVCKMTRFGGSNVQEVDGVWQLSSGQLIANMILRIDRVIFFKERGKTIYEGRILFQDQEYPFATDAAKFEKDPFKWMADHLLGQRAEVPNYANAWTQRAVTLSKHFHQPAAVLGIDGIGWACDRNALVFPRYVQSRDSIEANDTLVPFDGEPVPCSLFEPPEGLDDISCMMMAGHGPSTQIAWGVIIYLVSDVVAVAAQRSRPGLLLTRDASRLGVACARALGCVGNFDDPKKLRAYCTYNTWPVLVGDPREIKAVQGGSRSDSAAIAPAKELFALRMRLDGGWHVLSARTVGAMRDLGVAARRVLIEYLGDLCSRQFRISEPGLQGIINDVALWFTAQHGDFRAVRAGGRLLIDEATMPFSDVFADFLSTAYDGGVVLANESESKQRQNKAGIVTLGGDRIFLAKGSFDRLLRHHGAPPLDADEISLGLRDDNVLLEESWEDREGWIVSASWWHAKHSVWLANAKRRLRVVGDD